MNIYKHVILGLEQGIEREIAEVFHSVCTSGNPDTLLTGPQARFRIQNIKRAAVRMRELIDEEVRNAHEVSGAEASHVRGGLRQRQDWDSQEGRGGIRGQRQAWEAAEVRPQIEKREAVDTATSIIRGRTHNHFDSAFAFLMGPSSEVGCAGGSGFAVKLYISKEIPYCANVAADTHVASSGGALVNSRIALSSKPSSFR